MCNARETIKYEKKIIYPQAIQKRFEEAWAPNTVNELESKIQEVSADFCYIFLRGHGVDISIS